MLTINLLNIVYTYIYIYIIYWIYDIICFLHNYIKINYNKEYNDFLVYTFYNYLKIYTNCEIYFKKIKIYLSENHPQVIIFINKMNDLLYIKEEKNMYEFVKDGNSSLSCKENEKNDFIIFSDYKNSKNDCVKKIISRSNKLDSDTLSSYEPSSVKLISTEITINIDSFEEKEINISFCNDKYNYLIENNILDKKFIKYFMKKHYLNEIYKDDMHLLQNYKLKIIDDNINIDSIDETYEIHIQKDGKHIVKCNF